MIKVFGTKSEKRNKSCLIIGENDFKLSTFTRMRRIFSSCITHYEFSLWTILLYQNDVTCHISETYRTICILSLMIQFQEKNTGEIDIFRLYIAHIPT